MYAEEQAKEIWKKIDQNHKKTLIKRYKNYWKLGENLAKIPKNIESWSKVRKKVDQKSRKIVEIIKNWVKVKKDQKF